MVGVTIDDLTESERLLWEAFPQGTWLDLRAGKTRGNDPGDVAGWGRERIIRAEVISALLLGAAGQEPGYAPGVRLRGVLVKGQLDLTGATVAMPLVCECCHFDTELRLVDAAAKTVAIVDSYLPGFDGTRLRLDGILDFSASVITGMLQLDQARVPGSCACATPRSATRPQDRTRYWRTAWPWRAWWNVRGWLRAARYRRRLPPSRDLSTSLARRSPVPGAGRSSWTTR